MSKKTTLLICNNVGCDWSEEVPKCLTDQDRASRLSKIGGHHKNCRHNISRILAEVLEKQRAELVEKQRERNVLNRASIRNSDYDIQEIIDEENNVIIDEAIVTDDRHAEELRYLINQLYGDDNEGAAGHENEDQDDLVGQQSTFSGNLLPEEFWTTFQQKICIRDLSSLPMKVGWIRDPENPNLTVPGDRNTSVEIFEIVSKLNLTYAQGDLLLNFIRKLLKRKGLSVPLPVGCRSSCETVGKALLKDYENNVHFIEFYVADLYPQLAENHILLKALKDWSCRGAYVEPMVIIAEMIQHLKVSDIHSTFDYEGLDADGNPLPTRVWGDACSGLLAQKVFEFVSKNYSDGAFPIFVDVSMDDTPTKSMANDTCCPLYIVIASLIRGSDPWFREPVMLGYLPSFNKSKKMTIKDMMAAGLSKSQALKEYRYLFLKVRQLFVRKIFGALLSATKTGCLFSFKKEKSTSGGGSEGSSAAVRDEQGEERQETSCYYEQRLVVPVLRAFLNDNPQANELCGVCRSTKFVKMGCRFCTMRTEEFYTTHHEISEYNRRVRPSKGHEAIGRLGEYFRLRRLQKIGSKITVDEKHINSLLLKYSLMPIDNPIFEVFELAKYLEIPFVWHHPNDRLHTFLKGPLECSFKLMLIVLKRLEDYGKDGRLRGFESMVTDTGAELDRRILENFDFHRQPFNVTGSAEQAKVHLRPISVILGDDTKDFHQGSQGRGQIDGKDYIFYLIAVTLNLGHMGILAPNQKIGGVNPLHLMEKLGWTCIQVYWITSGDEVLESDVKELEWLIPDLIDHFVALFEYKQYLYRFENKLSVSKLHTLGHWPIEIRILGAPNVWDTSASEHKHGWIHDLFAGTSRRVRTRLLEILRKMLCQRKLELLRKEEEAAVAEGTRARSVEPPKKIAKLFTASDILLDQRVKAAAPAPSQQIRGASDGDVVEIVGQVVEALEMLQDQEEVEEMIQQVEFTIHTRCRRLYSQGYRETTGSWAFEDPLFGHHTSTKRKKASSGSGRLTFRNMFTTVMGNTSSYEERPTAQQREDTRCDDEDAKNTQALRFPFTLMSSISLAVENYMDDLRSGLYEEEALGNDVNDSHYTASSRAILQLYEDCKSGIHGTKLGLVESIRCFPPTGNKKSWKNFNKDKRSISFMYYATNRYNSSIITSVDEQSGGSSINRDSSTGGGVPLIGIEDNYSSSKSLHRRFDFVQATWINSIGETEISYARIMAILHLDSGKAPECRDVCFFYVAWLEEDIVEQSSSRQFSCCPLPRLKYTFRRPPHTNQLWCDIIGLDRIVQPVCAFHDPDRRPSYLDEGKSIANMKQNRFLAIPLSVAKKCQSQYSPIIGRGEILITKDNQEFRKNGMPVGDRSKVNNFFRKYHAPIRSDDLERDRPIM